jgi:hypothetical protein
VAEEGGTGHCRGVSAAVQPPLSKPEITADLAHVLDDLAHPPEDESPTINGE